MTAGSIEDFTGDRRLSEQLAFVLEVEKLKTVLRRTPLLDRSRVENDAEHTWQVALMAVVLSEHSDRTIDLPRVIKMLLIHDIVEIDAGDTFAFDNVGATDKLEREIRAAERIFELLPQDQAVEFRLLWDEFEANASPEALFANAIDRLQPMLHSYFTGGQNWQSASVTSSDVERRMQPVAAASGTLGHLVSRLVNSAIEMGILTPCSGRKTGSEAHPPGYGRRHTC
ncbi:HD domain-containing protein [Sinorhizobium sp. BG8]|nr:HD domain-containing protein [Sinorhizobium sp. BG8]